MDQTSNIEINELIEQETGEVVIRRGEAKKYRYPEGITVNGTIRSAREWWEINDPKEIMECKHARIEYCKQPGKTPFIDLYYHQVYADIRTEISGTLPYHPVLKEFGINSKDWGVKTLAKFIRRNKRFFSSNEFAMELYEQLNMFKARVSKDYTDTNDFRGNTEQAIKITTQQDFAQNVTVSLPVFVGYEDKSQRLQFELDIVLQPQDNGVILQFDCAEYEEQIENFTNSIMKEHLDFFKGKVPVIEVF